MKVIGNPERFGSLDKERIGKILENATALICVYIDKGNVYNIVQEGMNSAEAFYSIEKMRDWVIYEAFRKDVID